jgi:protein-disulfide isomerase
MDATKNQRTRAVSPNQQRNMLIMGAVIAAAAVIALIAIIISSNNRVTGRAEGYDTIPQSRTSDGAFVLGDPEAPITIVEFADFACPHCQDYSTTIHQFIDDYVVTGQAKLEYRMFISGADPTYGPYAAQLAECAETLKPGSFWQAHDVLYELGSRGRFNSTTASTLADRVGLQYSALLSCAERASQHTTDVRVGSSLNVQSTPTIMYRIGDSRPQFVNVGGRVWDRGPVPYEVLSGLIETAQFQ